MLTDEQCKYLGSMKFINIIDEHVKALAEYQVKYLPSAPEVVGTIVLILHVFYNSEEITKLSFNLRNYDYDELLDIAKNIKDNEFIMFEMDNALGGSYD